AFGRRAVVPGRLKAPRAKSRPVRKGAKLLVLVGLVAAGGLLAFAGAAPQGYAGVAALASDPAAFAGEEVEVKATVVEGSLDREAMRFVIGDGHATLPVRWDPARPLPDHEAGGTIEGKNVVVKGTLVVEEGGAVLLAREMQVGCASKYRAAE
ncbi:MAG TPA: cytochrome c maturation protein CcmE, partial [Candidatus Thermoplasmatota archaeon]|nr:cytochrome c maturation protein CcmE [Candidatus Thermoplasmatota archaeon]